MTLPGYELDEYQRDAARTAGNELLPENRDKGLNAAALGLCGETGEALAALLGLSITAASVADTVKKIQHHRHDIDAATIEKLHREAGDCLWYLSHLSSVMKWRLSDVAQANINKLRVRYPAGFETARSINRADV